MIIEYKCGEKTVTHNSIDDRIADANYYLTVATVMGNHRNKRKWLKRIKELEKLKREQENNEINEFQ